MDFEQLRNRLSSPEPQRHMLAMTMLGRIQECLGQLSGLGHHLELTPRDATAATLAFPQMLYRGDTANCESWIVESSAALAEALADGWREHPNTDGPQTAVAVDAPKGDVPPPSAILVPIPGLSLDSAIDQVGGPTASSPVRGDPTDGSVGTIVTEGTQTEYNTSSEQT